MRETDLIRVYGIVQGVGFRPFTDRLANRFALCGSVANKGSYVEIHLQGEPSARREFLSALEEEAPPRSAILRVDVSTVQEPEYDSFRIIESEKEEGAIFVSPDIATCPLCKQELFDPENRRYRHPFINCTACGPRLTILESMPYDRERTTMKEFPMCPECAEEYYSAESRRYDAQPVCCNDCGPEVYLIGRPEHGAEAIRIAKQAILDGKVLAIKGIGGFHLCCNAFDKEAVMRLRSLKHRPVKPFALMMKDLEAVRKHCHLPENLTALLDGHQKPIILLEKKSQSPLPEELAPGNPKLGIMLPYTPLHMLLFHDDGRPMPEAFVMTSGNVSGAPICRSDEDALAEISSFCDLMLSHNRKILLRADDSVIDTFCDEPYMIRRSRGYAPLPFMLSGDRKGQVLGIGGELKNTFCLGHDSLFYLSPYLGDMEDLRTVKALQESITRMESLLEVKPQLIACDFHPRYHTTEVAESLGLPLLKIQHHYAHILSCMAENDVQEPVIGVSFDGTGYGSDGTIWGGEILYSTFDGFERVGRIMPFLQAGGDASAKEGWRIAVSMIQSLFPENASEIVEKLELCTEQERKVIAVMTAKRLNTVTSTSSGRLFDAVSAILGICRRSTFEGEAAMKLQFSAECAVGQPEFSVPEPVVVDDILTMRTDLLVKRLVELRLAGVATEHLARLFHEQLAEMIASFCRSQRDRLNCNICALSGGVFQNTLLLGAVMNKLEQDGFRVLRHHLVPPNDGGIALGQAAAAMKMLNNKEIKICV